jgi:acetyl esterase/lipase
MSLRVQWLGTCLAAGLLLAQTPERRVLPPAGLYNPYPADQAGIAEAAKAAGLGEGKVYLLAQDLAVASVNEAISNRRLFAANEKLGDPAGLQFYATNNNGVYDIGDKVPMIARTRLVGHTPLPAKLRILRGDTQVAEAEGYDISFTPAEAGSYRLEARVGQDSLWIRTASVDLEAAAGRGITLPPGEIAATVEVTKDITYVEGKETDAGKHKLDLYLPKGKTGFPVLIFIHGGAWRSGDRALYVALGNRFAKEGIGVVAPSYRLMPGAPHPAQIEDAVAAVEWTLKNIAQHGGDLKQVWVSGHSAGGHLAAWVGLEKRLWPRLKGVIAMSGVYDLTSMPAFQGGGVDASPAHRVAAGAPPFTITYCQNDYPTLATQAKMFDAALRKAGVKSELVYIPGKNHITEIADVWRPEDPTAKVILRAVLGK